MFAFYDFETTGISPAFDQPIQFAAILVDEDLREVDRRNLRCRLEPHILPAPMALAVTGVNPGWHRHNGQLHDGSALAHRVAGSSALRRAEVPPSLRHGVLARQRRRAPERHAACPKIQRCHPCARRLPSQIRPRKCRRARWRVDRRRARHGVQHPRRAARGLRGVYR